MAFSSTIHDGGKKIALSGDQATCGNCKGAFEIFGTGKGMSEKGRNVVVDGDLVLCPCKKNRVIIGSNPRVFLKSDSDAARGGDVTAPAFIGERVYDEQVCATGRGAAEGYPYFIETGDGRIFSGRLDRDGRLPRVYTNAVDDYSIYWGDDALAKHDGA